MGRNPKQLGITGRARATGSRQASVRPDEPRYPIGAVSRLTGIPIDTLRAWERRYQVVSPARTDRGRMYGSTDVVRLRLLRVAVARGHGIGRVAGLTNAELERLLSDIQPGPPAGTMHAVPATNPVGEVLAALREYQFASVEHQLLSYALTMRPMQLVAELLLPLFRQVGEAWYGGRLSVAQEHFVASLSRGLLGSLIRLYAPPSSAPAVLFAACAGERHDLSLQAAALLAAAAGMRPIYVGADTPASDLAALMARTPVDVVMIGAVYCPDQHHFIRELLVVRSACVEGTELWIGGNLPPGVVKAVTAPGVIAIPDFPSLQPHLLRLGGAV